MRRGHTVIPVLTGVIYGAIVLAWATYLVPLALRRDEQAARSRSVERFSSAMRVLVSRGSRVAPVSRRTTAPPVASSLAELEPEPARMLVTPRADRAAERAAAARRRMVLYVLMSLALLCGLLSVAGVLPWWSFVAPVALIAGFLVVARQSVRKANAPYWVDLEPSIASTVTVGTDSVGAETQLVEERSDGEQDDAEQTIALTAAQRAAVASGPRVANGSTLWDPLPVTLPTYVDAPVARRAFRTIEIGSESRSTPRPAAAATTAASHPVHEDLTEDVPQAVNG